MRPLRIGGPIQGREVAAKLGVDRGRWIALDGFLSDLAAEVYAMRRPTLPVVRLPCSVPTPRGDRRTRSCLNPQSMSRLGRAEGLQPGAYDFSMTSCGTSGNGSADVDGLVPFPDLEGP